MWYVAETKPWEEDKARAHLANQGFHPYLPRILRTVRRARRSTVQPVPLFPCYLFIEGSTARRWRSINGTVGVKHLITFNERPAIVEAGFVERLLDIASPDGIVDLQSRLKVGDAVEFASGPMAGRIGQLVKLDGRGRAAVLMELLSGQVRVRTTPDKLLPA